MALRSLWTYKVVTQVFEAVDVLVCVAWCVSVISYAGPSKEPLEPEEHNVLGHSGDASGRQVASFKGIPFSSLSLPPPVIHC